LLLLRALVVLALLLAGVSWVMWLMTGNPRYRQFTLNLLKAVLLCVVLFTGMFALERLVLI
jgi:lipopolysaccharide export LptBFGC system permease protein LptF